ncbi:hypothetical protein HYT17_01175 [Candidatus Microgenomates bacterium]|nr:hypothetical protein [Candidatus Microgenomates bacterium]
MALAERVGHHSLKEVVSQKVGRVLAMGRENLVVGSHMSWNSYYFLLPHPTETL